MEQFKVDVRFPRASDENKNLVEITGDENDCYDCQDELLNLEEEYVSVSAVFGLVVKHYES